MRWHSTKRLLVPGGVLTLLGLVALFPALVTNRNPLAIDAESVLLSPSWGSPFGTDRLGRDIFARLIHGSRVSLSVAVGSVAIALLLGTLIGMSCGFIGKKLDFILMRFVDLLLSFPAFLLAITFAAALGPSSRNAAIALAVVYTPIFARVARSATISEVGKGYCDALRTIGVSRRRTIWRHLLPNISTPLAVQTSAALAQALLLESGLSFLGLGTQPPSSSWGSILSDGRVLLDRAPWVAVGASLFLCLSVLCLFALGDAVRDVLDPRSQ